MSRLGELLASPAAAAGAPGGEAAGSTSHARFHLAAAWLAAGRRDRAEGLIPRVLPPRGRGGSRPGTSARRCGTARWHCRALLAVEPAHPDVPALAQALADAGRDGEWRSTQDTAFAVMALGRYLKRAAKAEPYAGVELLEAGRVIRTAKAGRVDRVGGRVGRIGARRAGGPGERPGRRGGARRVAPDGASRPAPRPTPTTA
jgi:hypothetical protein